jgi:hypothetical protein
VMMVGVGAAAAVQRLAAGVPDRVDHAIRAQYLQVPVHRGEADVLSPAL